MAKVLGKLIHYKLYKLLYYGIKINILIIGLHYIYIYLICIVVKVFVSYSAKYSKIKTIILHGSL